MRILNLLYTRPKSFIISMLILLSIFNSFSCKELIEKCFNGPLQYNYTFSTLDDYLFPYGGIAIQKTNPLKYGDRVQIIANHTTIDSNFAFYNRSLIHKGNSSTWAKASSAYLFPSSKKQPCQERIFCANSNIILRSCSKCNWYGQIISDMSVCRSNLLKFKEEPRAFAQICTEFDKKPVPVDSAFRVLADSETWDFKLISGSQFRAVDKADLSECRADLPNFACFDMNQTNPDGADFYKFSQQGELRSQGKVNSGIFSKEYMLTEDEYNTLKVLSEGAIKINGTEYDLVDYFSGMWINSDYFVDCGSIKPVDPDVPVNEGGIGAFAVVLITVGALAAIGVAGYGITHFLKSRGRRGEVLLD